MGPQTILVIFEIDPHAGGVEPADMEKSRGIFVGLIDHMGRSPSPSKYEHAANTGGIFEVNPHTTAAAPSKG
ncbi:MAG TPA: hypothetical protein GX509_09895 [Firmicutes bacterium]|nr:hypothetical protein [Bacillota bacterium]